METHCIKTKISNHGILVIKGLPFFSGDEVEVTIKSYKDKPENRYPLRGKPFRYDDPFECVAADDWEVLK